MDFRRKTRISPPRRSYKWPHQLSRTRSQLLVSHRTSLQPFHTFDSPRQIHMHSQVIKPGRKLIKRSIEDRHVIFIHGLFGNSTNFQRHAAHLSQHLPHTIHSVDLRNHGQSEHSHEFDITTLTEDLIRYLDKNMIKQADLNVDLQNAKSRADVERQFEDHIPEAPIRQFLLTNIRRRDEDKSLYWRINLEGLARNKEQIADFPLPERGWAPFHKPVLMLSGGASPFVTPEHHPTVRRFFPAHRLVTFEGVGHWVHTETPRFLEIVTEFLH